jgi:hypothetical protein
VVEENMKLDWSFEAGGRLQVRVESGGLYGALSVDPRVGDKELPPRQAWEVLLRDLRNLLDNMERRRSGALPSIGAHVRKKDGTEQGVVIGVRDGHVRIADGHEAANASDFVPWAECEYAP